MEVAISRKHQNGFLPVFAQSMRKATTQDRERLTGLINQGEFHVFLEDLALYAHLSATVDCERGKRFNDINGLFEETRRPGGEELPSIVAGLRALDRKRLIRVNWGISGIKEKQPFTVMLTYQPEDFWSFLNDLNKTLSRATLNDLRHMKTLFHDHPQLHQETLKLGILLHLVASGTGTFTVSDLIEAFGLDRKEGRAAIVNALDYLSKQKLIQIQWVGTDAGTVNVDRMRTLFNITEGGR